MDPFNSSINTMDQLDDMYDFQDPVLNSMAPPSFNRSSSLTPLLSSWHVNPPSPQRIHTLKNIYNNDLSLDSIIDFMEPTSVDQAIHFSPIEHNNQQSSPNSPTTSQQDPNVNSPLLEYDVFNADVPFDFDTWNVLCSNDMYLSSSEPLSCSASENGSYINRKSSHQENISQPQQSEQEHFQNSQLSMNNKRKAVGNQCVEVNRKKRIVSRTQQQKKDIISCVIANLPADVIEEQQKAIPTAFPSRMRQTRIQAALKAQTDAMVQSCQQRIMKNSVNEITAPTSGQCSEMNGDAVQYIGAYTLEERRIRIARFREKRKHRVWDHAVKYNCRRKLAVGRVRVKGRFVKSGDDVQK